MPSLSPWRQLKSHAADSSVRFLTEAFFPPSRHLGCWGFGGKSTDRPVMSAPSDYADASMSCAPSCPDSVYVSRELTRTRSVQSSGRKHSSVLNSLQRSEADSHFKICILRPTPRDPLTAFTNGRNFEGRERGAFFFPFPGQEL